MTLFPTDLVYCNYANGNIVGSAFVKALEASEPFPQKISGFIHLIATKV
jgi:tryptophan synthase alpha subunit